MARLTKAQERKKKQESMKALFHKTKNEQLRKGQKGMTLAQRQADDMTTSRANLIKKGGGKDVDKKISRMKKNVSQQTGTSSKNIDKLKASTSANLGRVQGVLAGGKNFVTGLLKKKKK